MFAFDKRKLDQIPTLVVEFKEWPVGQDKGKRYDSSSVHICRWPVFPQKSAGQQAPGRSNLSWGASVLVK